MIVQDHYYPNRSKTSRFSSKTGWFEACNFTNCYTERGSVKNLPPQSILRPTDSTLKLFDSVTQAFQDGVFDGHKLKDFNNLGRVYTVRAF